MMEIGVGHVEQVVELAEILINGRTPVKSDQLRESVDNSVITASALVTGLWLGRWRLPGRSVSYTILATTFVLRLSPFCVDMAERD
jgi:hypothetical protein